MNSVNYAKHNKAWESSGLTMKQYCQKHQIGYYALRNYRYQNSLKKQKPEELAPEPKPRFKMFPVGIKIQLSVDRDGSLSLHGIMPEHLPNILKGLNALS